MVPGGGAARSRRGAAAGWRAAVRRGAGETTPAASTRHHPPFRYARVFSGLPVGQNTELRLTVPLGARGFFHFLEAIPAKLSHRATHRVTAAQGRAQANTDQSI